MLFLSQFSIFIYYKYMAGMSFQFKQFTIHHDLCGMKVGTDGVLLGAWAHAREGVKRVLDVGCGSGLIAIMLAQRYTEASLWGVDIMPLAVQQSQQNAAATPWSDRLCFARLDFSSAREVDAFSQQVEGRFQLIVCNPPFYKETTACPEQARHAARHISSLPLEKLLDGVVRLIDEHGVFQVIIPTTLVEEFSFLAWQKGLSLQEHCKVLTAPGKAPKRSLLSFVNEPFATTDTSTLSIRDAQGRYTSRYIDLVGGYYLNM